MSIVRLAGVVREIGTFVILDHVEGAIALGDRVGLVGPNGAGKTTILRAILGSLQPMAGTVTIRPGLRFGYVPQRDSVDYNFPLKVIDVVMMGRYDRIGLGRRPTSDDRKRACESLDHVGILALAEQPLAILKQVTKNDDVQNQDDQNHIVVVMDQFQNFDWDEKSRFADGQPAGPAYAEHQADSFDEEEWDDELPQG